MTNRPPPSLPKWIFVLTDILLLIGFAWTLHHVLPPKTTGDYATILTVAILWMVGAWICVKPWLEEFRARNRHLENETLASAVEQIQRLEEVACRIQNATGAWQTAQDAATRTATAAREIEEKIKANMKDFMEFTERVNGEEKKHLNLEIEKLRRTEGEWLQAIARMLDHTYLLTQAGHRSGQANLINQLNNFQNAMRDSVRRLGLVAFVPEPGEEFNARSHQTETPDTEPPAGAVVSDILATGFTYQGQLLRRALVRVVFPQQEKPDESQPAQEQTVRSSEPLPEETSAVEGIETERIEPDQTPIAEESANAESREPMFQASAEPIEELSGEPERTSESPAPIEPQPDTENQSRRRSRRPDPQTSLPF